MVVTDALMEAVVGAQWEKKRADGWAKGRRLEVWKTEAARPELGPFRPVWSKQLVRHLSLTF